MPEDMSGFLDDPQDEARLVAFVEEVLGEGLSLGEVLARKHLHDDLLHFKFEQLAMDGQVILLRRDGALYAVRCVPVSHRDCFTPAKQLPASDRGKVVQLASCAEFLGLWSQTAPAGAGQYDTESTIQRYTRALMLGESLPLHGLEMYFESVLGQGLEGTVFRVRDARTQERFALKASYKDLRTMFAYWDDAFGRIRREKPEILPYLCEFFSCEPSPDGHGSTLLMQYKPLVWLPDAVRGLSNRDRLRKGLRVLADASHVFRSLREMKLVHGDLCLSNTFLYSDAGGSDHTLLIDPLPEAVPFAKDEDYLRKDLFGLAHMLYWLVTDAEWPPEIDTYRERVMSGAPDANEASRIFSANPLSDDRQYRMLHVTALQALSMGGDASEHMLDMIVASADRLSRYGHAARVAPGADLRDEHVEDGIAAALKPIGSGVFLPLFSLPSYFGRPQADAREYGMGDTGPAAKEFVRRLKATGQKFWALLPIGPADQRNCPYRTDSAFAISPNTVPPESLIRDGWITEAELDSLLPHITDPDRVPLTQPEVLTYKRDLLCCAYDRYHSEAKWHGRFATFLRDEQSWLHSYALYKAIESEHRTRWTEWPAELRDAEPTALEEFGHDHADAIWQEAFFQFLSQHYFLELRTFAEAHGIALIGDLPAYSMHGSADVWANRSAFQLGDIGQRTLVAGVPPDKFASGGQAWNHPMYRWDDPATEAFLRARYARMRRLFGDGFVRDDHIIGKVTPWGYRYGASPTTGSRVQGKYLGGRLFNSLLAEIPDLPRFLIAEDLGTVTDETKRLMMHYGFMGMKVLQFIPFNSGPQAVAENMYTPGNYPDNNVILLGTHDLLLVRDWWRQELTDEGRRYLSRYLQRETERGEPIDDANVATIFTEYAMRQTPNMMIHRMADLIIDHEGSVGLTDARMNDPACGHHSDRWTENWSWRLAPDAFGPKTRRNLANLTNASNRCPDKAIRRLAPDLPITEEMLLAASLLRECGPQEPRLSGRREAMARRLETMAREGFVRTGRFVSGVLSAVYQTLAGSSYLLLSDHAASNNYMSPAQKAVSIVRAFEAYMRREDKLWTSPLVGVNDDELVRWAERKAAHTEDELQYFVSVSSDELREEMVAFAGALMEPDGQTDLKTLGRMKRMKVTRCERAALAKRYRRVWTDIWRTYEDRGVSRRNIVEEILRGKLHGAWASLRGLRWCVAGAYSAERAEAAKTRQLHIKLIDEWAGSLDLQAVEKVLFGYGLENKLSHDLDEHGCVEGVSGLLGLIRKSRRKELDLRWRHESGLASEVEVSREAKRFYDGAALHDLERFYEYVISLIRTSGEQPAQSQALISLIERLRNGERVRHLEALLGLLEQQLILRLAEVKPPVGEPPDPGYPAQIDTQMHSYYSDCGGQSVARIVYEAYQRGLKTIAITDHETFEGVVEACDIGKLVGVHVIPAVEMYTGIRRDGFVDERRDILVYFPDVDRFRAWYARGLDEETWSLFNDGWNRREDGRQWGDVPVRRVTDWSHARGGVAVCAHPGLWHAEVFHREHWDYDAFRRFFSETRLAGIEISHSKLPFEENTRRYVPLVRRYNNEHPDRPIVFTMGTDAHEPDDIGRANLTEDTVRFVARGLAAGDRSAAALRDTIVKGIERTAFHFADTRQLYRLRAEILSGVFPGADPQNRPLTVKRTDVDAESETIVAGATTYNDRPVIIAVNLGRREQSEGKDWGVIDVTEVPDLHVHTTKRVVLRDLETGEETQTTGAQLREHGLSVGLAPYATQFLIVEQA
jgi:4-alpha-glucanotransferase